MSRDDLIYFQDVNSFQFSENLQTKGMRISTGLFFIFPTSPKKKPFLNSFAPYFFS